MEPLPKFGQLSRRPSRFANRGVVATAELQTSHTFDYDPPEKPVFQLPRAFDSETAGLWRRKLFGFC